MMSNARFFVLVAVGTIAYVYIISVIVSVWP